MLMCDENLPHERLTDDSVMNTVQYSNSRQVALSISMSLCIRHVSGMHLHWHCDMRLACTECKHW